MARLSDVDWITPYKALFALILKSGLSRNVMDYVWDILGYLGISRRAWRPVVIKPWN